MSLSEKENLDLENEENKENEQETNEYVSIIETAEKISGEKIEDDKTEDSKNEEDTEENDDTKGEDEEKTLEEDTEENIEESEEETKEIEEKVENDDDEKIEENENTSEETKENDLEKDKSDENIEEVEKKEDNEKTDEDNKQDSKTEKFKRIWKNNPQELSSESEKMIANILSYVKIIVAAFLLALFMNTFILSNTTVPSGSMENTIQKKDRLMGFRLSYKFSEPERGDVIIFKFPDNESENYIKRIVGLPGETVEIKKGVVYINGEPLDENEYLKEVPNAENFGPYNVPENAYFVMGDNRNSSVDARYWKNTYVYKDKIIAKAIFKYYPRISMIK